MGYFKFTSMQGSVPYESEWRNVVTQIQNWPDEYLAYHYPLSQISAWFILDRKHLYN